MNYDNYTSADSFRPRIIVWQIADPEAEGAMTLQESLLTIDGIARTAKPIVVLMGNRLTRRPDVFEIIEYGTALGLKMIIESRPEDLDEETLGQYARFGQKIFRIVVDGYVRENPETRFEQSEEFLRLQEAVGRLRAAEFEIHLRVTVRNNDIRALAFYHDFAVRIAAEGLYCHLSFPATGKNGSEREDGRDEVIEAIARMKRFSSKEMYVSPQCVKYGVRRLPDEGEYSDGGSVREHHLEWRHTCLGGRTFAFITPQAKVQICAGQRKECGDLRNVNYKFDEIWGSSEFFRILRETECSCEEVQDLAVDVHDLPAIFIDK